MLEPTALIELVYADASGSQGAVQLHSSVSHTVAEIAAEAEALAAIVASVTGCELMTYRIKYKVRASRPLPAAIGGSVKRQGSFYFHSADDGRDWFVSIPGIDSDVLETSGPFAGYRIDATNADIDTFIDALLVLGACNPEANAFTEFVVGIVEMRS